jgi:hypothetical protein
MNAPLAALIAVVVVVMTAPLLVLLGAFSLRLTIGVATYRDSGAWMVVVAAAIVAAIVLGVLCFRGLVAKKR